jgi:hypothetical protein
MKRASLLCIVSLCLAPLAVACGGAQTPGVPVRPVGCAVEVVHEGVPTRPVRSLGQVEARCRGTYAHDEARCMRELQDQACRMGATVIWDVRSEPMETEEESTRMRASAAIYR